MAYEFKLPDLGEGLTEGEVARWLVAEGDEVAEDQPLVEIQTDKTTVEIPSPAAGKVASILVEEGKVVPVGTILVVIGGDGADVAHSRQSPRPGPRVRPQDLAATGRVRATPLVRRLAQELDVDLEALTGTGPQGRVTEADVRGAATSGGQAPGHGSEGRREPLRGVRRLIAEHMARAHREVPAVTWVEECDFGGLDLKLLLPTVLKACAEALQEFPELNARLEGDEIVYLDRYDLGVAVQTDEGLVVPVVRGCDSASIDELAAEVARLAEGARAGTLKPEELRGSTFTVTSAGKLAGLFQTPIVNHPEVAILSIGRIAERPVVREGGLAVAQIGYVSLTFDHRVVDGARAAEFGLAVIGRLEASRSLEDEEPGPGPGSSLQFAVRWRLLVVAAPAPSVTLADLAADQAGAVSVVWTFAYVYPFRIARMSSAISPAAMPCRPGPTTSAASMSPSKVPLRIGVHGRLVAAAAQERAHSACHAALAEVDVRGSVVPSAASKPS